MASGLICYFTSIVDLRFEDEFVSNCCLVYIELES